ncbi:Deoxyribonuclease TatD [Serratia fonticola]|uniref:Deoxyribonuclease TatD n=1 Tax=Serratia fonticola TaxID=47917 RepID=A0A3S4XV21_SERFO|nr:Deoxyribonuclease TatD [Serratia fonticola]
MFDIGVNLTSSQFAKDATQVVERAKTAGVTGMLITGTNAQQSEAASHLARAHSGYCWSTAGVHPHDASSWNDEVAQHIHRLASQPFVAAIGECGLDFNRNFSTTAQQELAFNAQLALAAELNMPVFLHCRDAHARFVALLTLGWINCPPQSCIASPAAPKSYKTAWRWGCRLVSPVGFVMSAGVWNCVPCYPKSRPNACCWKPMPPICCPGIYTRNLHLAATNPVFCPISFGRLRPGAKKIPRGWARKLMRMPAGYSGWSELGENYELCISGHLPWSPYAPCAPS